MRAISSRQPMPARHAHDPGVTASARRDFLAGARTVSVLTFLSRVSGLIRDVLLSHVFGAGAMAAAFAVAFTVPNLFRRLFGEGALSAAFIPQASRLLTTRGRAAATALLGATSGWLGVLLITLISAGELLLLFVVLPFVAGQPRGQTTVLLTAMLLPYALMICQTALLGGMLHVLGRFAAPASAPIVLNAVLIVALVALLTAWPGRESGQVYVLGAAVLVGGVLQFGLQRAALRREGIDWRPTLPRRDPQIVQIARTMLPMAFGLAAVQVNTLADTLMALWFVPDPGAPAVLYYGQRLYQFPLGVFGIALATAAFPALSTDAARADGAALRGTLQQALRVSFFIGLPTAAGLVLVAHPLVRACFEHGAFAQAEGAAGRVAWTLMAFASAVWAYGLNHVLVRGYYAVGDYRTPLRVAAWMVAVNLVLNLILVWPLRTAGLALATALCGVLQFGVLARRLARRLPGWHWRALGVSAGWTMAATATMAAAVGGLRVVAGPGMAGSIGAVGELAVEVLVGGGVFVGTAWVLRMRELREVLGRGV